MSCTNTHAAIDPYLNEFEEEPVKMEQLDAIFAAHEGSTTSPTLANDALYCPNRNFNLDSSSWSTVTSSDSDTACSTPNFTDFSFGHRDETSYPPPGINASYPYPISTYYYPHHVYSPRPTSRPHPTRSYTASPHLATNRPLHRRSLSQGDADRIAAVHASPLEQQHQLDSNPTFVRLQSSSQSRYSPRYTATSNSNDNKSTSQPSSHGARHAKTKSLPPTSAPLPDSTNMVETKIGTPLEELVSYSSSRRNFAHQETVFRHMSLREQARTSAKVIELGALAVLNAQKGRRGREQMVLKDKNEECGSMSENCKIWKRLDEVERHLRRGWRGSEEGLRGCKLIRNALLQQNEPPTKCRSDGVRSECGHDGLDAHTPLIIDYCDNHPVDANDCATPSSVYSERSGELYDNSLDKDYAFCFPIDNPLDPDILVNGHHY